MKQPYFLLFAALIVLLPHHRATAKGADHRMPIVAVVSTTNDAGRGSLRAAIESANRNAGTHIVFRLPTSASTFLPLSPLPPLLKPDTYIEGQRLITILGDHNADEGTGLRIEASRCRVTGVKWRNWPEGAISIQGSGSLVQDNLFNNMPIGITVRGAKSRGNRLEANVFDEVKVPIGLREGSNNSIAAPLLTIVRDDATGTIGHRFTLKFTGKAKSDVTFELGYSANEVREGVQVEKIHSTHTARTDARGNALWTFERKGYPVGSWTATATQNGSTSEFSNVVVMPYL